MVSLTVRRAKSVEGLEQEWRLLEGHMFPRLPFAGPDWVRVWLRHFAQSRLSLADELVLLEVRDDGGSLRGVAPMVLSSRPSVGPIKTRMLRSLGADPNITELASPACAPADAPEVFAALLEWLEAHRSQWDLLFFNGIPEGADAVFERRAKLEWGTGTTDFLLELKPTWEEFKTHLGRNIKESLRKCYNSLKRDGHTFEFRVVGEATAMRGAVEEFFRLHAARASLSGTVDHQDVFALPRSRSFLSSLMEEKARRGEARAFQLVIGGGVVATRLGFVLGDQLYLYFSGFDPRWGDYSVMTTTVAESIRWAIDERLRWVNLSPGRDVSKTRWGPRELVFREAFLPSSSLRGDVVHRSYRALRTPGSRLARLLAFAKRH